MTHEHALDQSYPRPVWVDDPSERREQEFKEGLRELLNYTGMDSQCGTPDFVLVESVMTHLNGVRQTRIAQARHEGREIRGLSA